MVASLAFALKRGMAQIARSGEHVARRAHLDGGLALALEQAQSRT
jgi:hypothetical protein